MSSNPPKTKYLSPFSIRFTEEERKALEAAAAGRPLSDYIKDVLGKYVPSMPKKQAPPEISIDDRQAIAKILGLLGQSRIPNNINQLAKAANSGSLPVNEEVHNAILEACRAIIWIRDTLIKALKIKPLREKKDSAP